MTDFGDYIVVEVAKVTPRGSISTARPAAGGPASFAVKQVRFPGSDPDEPRWDAQRFLDRARVQKSVVAAGGRYWAPIHDLGVTDEAAWIVTDYFPLSAQKLIDAKLAIDEPSLFNLINCVVRGLVELQQVRRRPHGSLKPSNVLIESGGQLAEARVLLTDPAQGVSEGEVGDLFGLGHLIYELVMHRPYAGGIEWPLPYSAAWGALGKHAKDWRELCSALLNPVPEARPNLVEVTRILRGLAPQRRRFRKRYLVPPAVAAGIALLLSAMLGMKVSSARHEFASARHGWIDSFAAALSDPQRRARYQHDPDLANVLNEFDYSRLASAPVNGPTFSLAELRRLRSELAAAHRVELDLSPLHWRRLGALAKIEQQYRTRGWEQPANALAEVIDATQPRPGVLLASAIDHADRVQAVVNQQQPRVEKDWLALEASARSIDSRGDGRLAAFAVSLRREGASAVRFSDAGFSGLDKLESVAALSARVANATRNWPGDYDVDRLAVDLGRNVELDRPTPAVINAWLAKLPMYAVRRADTAAAAAALQKQLDQTAAAVAPLTAGASSQQKLQRDRRQIAADIQQFARTPFTQLDIDGGTFAARQKALATQVEALHSYARAQTPAEWIASLPSLATASKRVNQFWETWKQAQLAASKTGPDDGAQLASLKIKAHALQSGLTGLDERFPPAPADLPHDFAEVARQHRDAQIAKLLDGLDPQTDRLDTLRVSRAALEFSDWCNSLRDLAKDFPIRKQLLMADDRPDEKWSVKDSFWNDPAVQALVKSDLDRLSRLRRLQTAPRDTLLQTARESDSPELALQAWRLLGQDAEHPWPANPSELREEGVLRRRLENLLATIQDPAERAAPTDLLRHEGPVRWRRAVENATDEDALASAWDARGEFAVSDAQLNSLSPAARFNLSLWRTRQAISKADDAALAIDVNGLRKAAAELKDRPPAVAALAAIDRGSAAGPFAAQKPGEWFRTALLGAQPPVEFKRVEPKSGRPFYLATTDVSLKEFVAVVDAAGAWDECRRLPWAYRPGERDTRPGPRVWEWSGATRPRLIAPQLWLTNESDNDFAQPLRAERFNRMVLSDAAGGSPSEQHPMQQVSAETALWFARLCGCRLPTSREWLAAYDQYEKKGSIESCNLRDWTFELQRAYVSANRAAQLGGQWPDAGIFLPPSHSAATGIQARSRLTTDGALYFRPVDASGGSTFHHLIGNVAQYVCDAADKFEASAGTKSADGIAAFVRESPRKIFVIGGSALSPPELPIDQPLPVDHPEQGYADVGFRLAFTAPPRSLYESMKWALAGQSYLWPARARSQ